MTSRFEINCMNVQNKIDETIAAFSTATSVSDANSFTSYVVNNYFLAALLWILLWCVNKKKILTLSLYFEKNFKIHCACKAAIRRKLIRAELASSNR